MTVYHAFDQAALDAQYNCRAMVPEHPRHIEGWAHDSEAVRTAHPDARLDLAYGSGERERLDFFPAQPGAPLHLFIHGGYWRALDKANFSYPAAAFASAGVAYAAINYPLAPRASVDVIVASVRRALAWLIGHAGELGVDPAGISLSGHSAGGHLTAMALADPALPRGAVRGAVPISGLYDLEPIRLSYLNGELGLDAAAARRNSPIHAAPSVRCPVLLAVGGRESPEFHRQQASFADAWRGQCAGMETMISAGDDHFSIVGHLGDPGSALFRAVARLARGEASA
ncbi:MAG: alpha/beta hydrolase [Alphaproteobacteria bacterium]|nr:alpha/beta hydrolase [Alphaproteobacteria bacterium]